MTLNSKGKLASFWTVLGVVAVLALVLGCSVELPQETPSPTTNVASEPEATQPVPESITADSTRATEDFANTQKSEPMPAAAIPVSDSPMLPTATPGNDIALLEGEATAPPGMPDVTATPEPPEDICSRNPELQWAIIDKLNISSCQVINASELFRMRDLTVVPSAPLQPGDFADMPNLLALEVAAYRPLPANVFVGLSGLRRLSIDLRSGQSESMIQPHTFAGLEKLLTMEIAVEGQGYVELEPQTLAGLGSLEKLSLNRVKSVEVGALVDLPALEFLELDGLRVRDESTGEYQEEILDTRVFSRLPALIDLDVHDFELSSTMDFYSPTVVCHLPEFGNLRRDELEAITIGGQPAELLQEWDWDEDNCLVEVGSTIVKVEKPDDWDR